MTLQEIEAQATNIKYQFQVIGEACTRIPFLLSDEEYLNTISNVENCEDFYRGMNFCSFKVSKYGDTIPVFLFFSSYYDNN